MNPGTIILLNGASSSGKTSIVRAWQTALPEAYLRIHAHGIYDFEVDTSLLSPEACALAIQQAISGRAPTALRRLRDRRRGS